MTTTYKHKNHEITLNYDGKFAVTINGMYRKFASLKSAQNAIDKDAVIEFPKQDVLKVTHEGYNPSVYKVEKITLVRYSEEKGYRSREVNRYVYDSKGNKYNINSRWSNTDFYPLDKLSVLKELVEKRNKAERDASTAEKLSQSIGMEICKIDTVDVDPLAHS